MFLKKLKNDKVLARMTMEKKREVSNAKSRNKTWDITIDSTKTNYKKILSTLYTHKLDNLDERTNSQTQNLQSREEIENLNRSKQQARR